MLPSELKDNFILNEKGSGLSQGEKQRILIARALAKKPKILILDEATNHLDVDVEYRLLNNIYRAYPELTMILITHRIMSVIDYDKIIVLDNGNIVGQGTHKELKETNSTYQKYLSYFRI